MKRGAIAFLAGVIFAVGLVVGGMTRPSKVIGFLDVTGAWDASLAFVMGGAVALTLVFFRFILRRPAPVLDGAFHLPTRRDVDARLLIGAALFGVGWGLAGYCPGPGIVSLVSGHAGPLVFVVAMVAGIAAQRGVDTLAGAPEGPASTGAASPGG